MIVLTHKVKINGEETTLTYEQWCERGFQYVDDDGIKHFFPSFILKGDKLWNNGKNYEVLH